MNKEVKGEKVEKEISWSKSEKSGERERRQGKKRLTRSLTISSRIELRLVLLDKDGISQRWVHLIPKIDSKFGPYAIIRIERHVHV